MRILIVWGAPSHDDFVGYPLDASLRVIIQAISIIGVNVFVLISGWFGIRASLKGCCKLLFQCFFLMLLSYGIVLLFGLESFSLRNTAILFLGTRGLWFVKAYLVLYIISPILNTFIETVSQQFFLRIVLSYWAFIIIYGWIFPTSTGYMCGGYSPVFFIALYLLARYIKIYSPKFSRMPIKYDLLLVLGIVVLNSSVYLYSLNGGGKLIFIISSQLLERYLSPTVTLISLFMLLVFSKLYIKSKFINWLAAGSFAVYLLHCTEYFAKYYIALCRLIHENTNAYTYWLSILVVCSAVYFLCIIVDQIRIFVWNRLSPLVDKLIAKVTVG